jgi:hypothetical protein
MIAVKPAVKGSVTSIGLPGILKGRIGSGKIITSNNSAKRKLGIGVPGVRNWMIHSELPVKGLMHTACNLCDKQA